MTRLADAAALREKLRRRAELTAERASLALEVEVEGRAPVRSSPSTVGPQTIRRRKLSDSPRIAWSIRAESPQSEYTDKGTRPHVIRPRRPGGVLVFYWPKAGATMFLRHVNHPGNKGTGWFTKTIRSGWLPALRRERGRVR